MLDLGIDLNVWPWVWLGIAVFFAAIELTVLAGSFVILPFAISAFGASLLGFYDVAIELQWLTFIGGGAVLWILLYRYAQKFAGENQVAPGVGADRLIGLDAIVTTAIDPNDSDRRGRVTAQGDIWGALSEDGRPLTVGTHVRIVAVSGTRAIVRSIESADPPLSPSSPPIAPPPPSHAPPASPPPTSPPPASSPQPPHRETT